MSERVENVQVESLQPAAVSSSGAHPRFEWLSGVCQSDAVMMVELMNTVSVNETTLGFFEPISSEEGCKMMQSLDAEIAKGGTNTLVARDATGRIVGMLTLTKQSLPARQHIVEMKRCVIEPESRGRFVLKAWGMALDMARAMGCEMIIIDVRSDGRAERLWRRLGFKEYGRLDDYARVRGRIITGYFLYGYVSEMAAYRNENGKSLYMIE